MFAEALVVNFLDEMDSKLEAVRAPVRDGSGPARRVDQAATRR